MPGFPHCLRLFLGLVVAGRVVVVSGSAADWPQFRGPERDAQRLKGPLNAADWPQFRGPERDGAWTETGILQAFPPKGPKVLWRQPVGWGYSSPVIAQGRVFVTDARLEEPNAWERVHCFDAASGEPIWQHSYPVTYPDWAFIPEHGSGPCATPMVEEGRIYSLGANGQVHCLDTGTGAVRWVVDLAETYKIEVLSCRPSPLIDGNLLILSVGGKPGACVIALDKASGREVWTALDEPVSNSSPILIEHGGKRQLIVWTGKSVSSLEPATGQTIWRRALTTSNNDAIPTPVHRGDRLLIGGLMLRMVADPPGTEVLWPRTLSVPKRILSNTSTALWQGNHVYSALTSGELVCLDARTGKQVWKETRVNSLKNGSSIHLTPNGDGVFLFTDEGNLIRARLTPEGYHETGRTHLIDPKAPFGGRFFAWTPPSYALRRVYARNREELVCASLAAEP